MTMHKFPKKLAGCVAFCLTLIAAATVSMGADRPDAWITAKAKLALMTAEGVDSFDISVDTTSGYVTLSGDVTSDAERKAAERIVRDIDGVQDVRNLLSVGREAPAATEVADDALAEELEDALEDDWGLEDADIEVESVKRGVVVLDGEADSLATKQRAIALVRNYPGVSRVIDRIDEPTHESDDDRVWSTYGHGIESAREERSVFDDAWITMNVKLALMARDDVPALDVNVDTYDRTVTLFGIVPDETAKRAAGLAAREVEDVASVENQLQVVPESRRERVDEQDDVLAERVEEALDNLPALESADIETEVKNGVVRLTGTLEHEAHRLIAVSAARSVSGVRAVTNDLRLDDSDTD